MSKYTHQPFLYLINECANARFLLFCEREELTEWKIFNKEIGQNLSVRIDTGLLNATECSPHISIDNANFIFTFIGVTDCSYNLYKSEWKPSNKLRWWEDMPTPRIYRHDRRSGFENKKYILSTSKDLKKITLINKKDWKIKTAFLPFIITRISYQFDDPEVILVTGMTEERKEQTFLYQATELQLIGELKIDRKSVYKSSILNGIACYSKKTGDFEQRRIFFSENWEVGM